MEQPSFDVTLNMYGATCHDCVATVRGGEEALKPFYERHQMHNGFAWICTVASPPEVASAREFEVKFTREP